MTTDPQESVGESNSGCLKLFLVVLAIAVFLTGCIYLTSGDDNFDYCADRMYDQGFRGDDLTVMIEACMRNPGR